MLNHLVDYANRKGLVSEPGFAAVSIRWGLLFDDRGTPHGVMEWPESGKNGRMFPCCPKLEQPQLAGTPKSQFLYETAEVLTMLGESGGEVDDPKKHAKHRAFVELHKKAGEQWSILLPLAASLEDEVHLSKIRTYLVEKRVKPKEKVALVVGTGVLVEDPRWHTWWRSYYDTLTCHATDSKTKVGKSRVPCLATGELVNPVPIQFPVMGLAGVGGRGTGDKLASFDKDAFTSFGLDQAANAPMSGKAAAACAAALNEMLARSGKRLAGAKVVFWYDREVEEDSNPISFLDWGKDEEGDEESDELNALHKARQLLNAVQSGELRELGASRYFMLTLSCAAGRVMVRDWVEGQFGTLARNVVDWFEDMTIIHREGGRLAPSQKFISVLLALHSGLGDKASFPDKTKRIPPPFAAKMWRVAVCGERLPDSVLAKVLAQFRSDLVVNAEASPWARMNHARLGIMKAYFVRQAREKGVVNHMTIGLNENHPNPAYHCGRLMAVLAAVQNAALGTVGAGVVQRYYAAASATPALVFGRLVRTSQFHLGKLDAGLALWFDRKIADIWNRLRQDPPKTLSLEEQTLFAMGYYQQMSTDLGGNVSDKGEKIETAEISKEA